MAILSVLALSGAARAEAPEGKVWSEAEALALVRRHLPENLRVGKPLTRESRLARPVGYQSAFVVVPVFPITAAPNQPEIQPNETEGVINALCDVQLYIVGCPFRANAATLTCDTNADGISDAVIQLKDVRVINANLIRVTVPALSPQLPGTAFPLSCCGGIVRLTMIQHIGAGDDNVFGEYTVKASVDIDIGRRAPVVISASPSNVNCAVAQNLQVPGACYLLPDGAPNVTSVFAVEVGNPANRIEAKAFVVLTSFLIDALFEFGAANAGKEFLIFVSGPNGTSRNLTTLPQGAPANCPLGNEQGVKVTVTCDRATTPGDAPTSPPPSALVFNCAMERTDAGGFQLIVTGQHFRDGALVTIGGVTPKKMKLKDPDFDGVPVFKRLVLKGRFCQGLPGIITVTNPGERPSPPFQCNQVCLD